VKGAIFIDEIIGFKEQVFRGYKQFYGLKADPTFKCNTVTTRN